MMLFFVWMWRGHEKKMMPEIRILEINAMFSREESAKGAQRAWPCWCKDSEVENREGKVGLAFVIVTLVAPASTLL
jgi:hypothetical protein